MVSIKDVAKAANVSTATASRALRGVGRTSKATIARVKKAASDLGYVVNTSAQQLKNYAPKRVGFIISDANNSYYLSILASLRGALKEQGYELTISFSEERKSEEKKAFQTLIGIGASAILFTPSCDTNEEIIETAKKNGVQAIQLFRDVYPNLDSIINDDEQGAFDATDWLAKQGMEKVLLIDASYSNIDYAKVKPSRTEGFRRALRGKDIASKILHLPLYGYSVKLLKKAIDSFDPDAIVAGTVSYGYDVLKLLKGRRRQQTEIISFDDNEWFELMGISAIHQDASLLSESIKKLIFEPHEKPQKIKIPEQLIVRG